MWTDIQYAIILFHIPSMDALFDCKCEAGDHTFQWGLSYMDVHGVSWFDFIYQQTVMCCHSWFYLTFLLTHYKSEYNAFNSCFSKPYKCLFW